MSQMTTPFFSPCLFAAVHLPLPPLGLPQSNELLRSSPGARMSWGRDILKTKRVIDESIDGLSTYLPLAPDECNLVCKSQRNAP